MPRININETFMNIAYSIAELSYAEKRKVGCIIVKDLNVIAIGYNGTPSGFDNECEIEQQVGFVNKNVAYGGKDQIITKLVTKPEVLHAETNAISKCARSNSSSDGATIYTTLEPCLECSKSIIQTGIVALYYDEEWKNHDGVNLLIKAGIQIYKTNIKR